MKKSELRITKMKSDINQSVFIGGLYGRLAIVLNMLSSQYNI